MSQRFHVSMEKTRDISEFTHGFLHNLLDESRKLETHANEAEETQMKSIAEFEKAYEVNVRSLNSVRNFHHGIVN